MRELQRSAAEIEAKVSAAVATATAASATASASSALPSQDKPRATAEPEAADLEDPLLRKFRELEGKD